MISECYLKGFGDLRRILGYGSKCMDEVSVIALNALGHQFLIRADYYSKPEWKIRGYQLVLSLHPISALGVLFS